ncbi:hypothetical protein EFS32_13070, partial [Levilactobacillus parabrevis]|nr:hypothetical protein [Levilactobacillus parabrevis]
GLVWFGLVWFGLVWFGLVWFGLVWSSLLFYIAETCSSKQPVALNPNQRKSQARAFTLIDVNAH